MERPMVDTWTRIASVYNFPRGLAVSVKIFISCVSDEFRPYRDQLRHDLTLPDVEVKIQEDFKDQGRGTLNELDTYINMCDAVVHLVGHVTGAVPWPLSAKALLAKYPDIAERLPPLQEPLKRGEDIPYTQWEAWLALYHEKRLLIAKADDEAPRGPGFMATPASRAAQQAHLDRLRAFGRYPGCTFVTADQLAKYVLASPVLNLMVEEQSRPTPHDTGWLSLTGFAIGILVLLVTPWVSEQWAKTLGVPVAAPLALMLAVGGFALPLIYLRYFTVLGASDEREGSRDRKGYDHLRENLSTGGAAVRLYSRWLTAFLDRVDGFFGDAGMAERTLFPHAFGLKTPVPLWTAPAFDRCLLLALLYPIAAVFMMWALSGHVGPAEEVLGLRREVPWMRGIAVTSIGACTFAQLRLVSASGDRSIMWAAAALAFAIAGSLAGASAVIVVVTFAVGGAGLVTGVIAGASVVAGAVAVTVAISVAFAIAFAFASGFVSIAPFGDGGVFVALLTMDATVLIVGPAAAVAWLGVTAIRNQWHSEFLLSYFIVMTSGCLVAAHFLGFLPNWNYAAGPWLLFIGLLTLLNTPFDWASLGLTRALLRRGLELKGWWPFALAVADALAAAVVIALLALTLVIGVQAFDTLAVHAVPTFHPSPEEVGGKPVLPLVSGNLSDPLPQRLPLLEGIAANPEAPEYWWVYALLLSTMIPSLINLVIGGTALMRAVPGLPRFLLHFLPAAGGVRTYDRAWIAAVLTLQATLGVILGVAVQALVAWGLIFQIMPAAGLGLLDLARGLAALNLPMQLIELLAGTS